MTRSIRLAARVTMLTCAGILLMGLGACETDEASPVAPGFAPSALVVPDRVVAGTEIVLAVSGDPPAIGAISWDVSAGAVAADPGGRADRCLWRAPADPGRVTVRVSVGAQRLSRVITVLASWCSIVPSEVSFAADAPTTTITVINATGAEQSFTAAIGMPWLTVEPAAGMLPAGETELTLTVDRVGLLIGEYVDRLVLDCGGVTASASVHVPVTGAAVVFTCVNHDPAYQNIRIKGSWTNWETRAMERDGDVWTYREESLAPGEYEYGYIEDDGTEFGLWLLPGPNLEVAVAADGTVSGQTMFTIPEPPDQTTLTLFCDMSTFPDPFESVGVRGSFNGWDPAPTPMSDNDGDGVFAVVVDVNVQTQIIFKTVVDGAWYETVPAECGVDDGYGGYNRMVEIHEIPVVYAYPWAGCPDD